MTQLQKPLFMPPEIEKYLAPGDAFTQVMALQGRAFRDVPGRRTVQIQLGGKSYFVKQHFGVGWGEIFKNLLTFKLPVISAKTEMQAIRKLNEIGIATTPLVAFGERGRNPATLQSFLITLDLGDILSLEALSASWEQHPPTLAFKRALITAVAKLAVKLHQNGLNHRDFYLCHLCLDAAAFKAGRIHLYLIDLHRMRQHRQPNQQDNMKDIAALYFSSLGFSSKNFSNSDCGLSARDYLRFKYLYGRLAPHADAGFWRKVSTRAEKLYAKFHSDKFQDRLKQEKSALNHD